MLRAMLEYRNADVTSCADDYNGHSCARSCCMFGKGNKSDFVRVHISMPVLIAYIHDLAAL